MKRLVLTGILCLSTLGILSAKSYSITLSNPTQVGNLQLRPGDYKVKVEGEMAVFTNLDHNKQFSVPVKVESSAEKYDDTAVVMRTDTGVDRMEEIDLGGSHTKLEIGSPSL